MKSKELQKNTEENDIDYDQQQEETFHPIDLLQEHGINASDISKLRDAGFNSIESVTYSTKKNFSINKRSFRNKSRKNNRCMFKNMSNGFYTK